MDVLRPVRSFGVGPTTMLLAVVAALVLAVLAPVLGTLVPVRALAAVGDTSPSITVEPAEGAKGSTTTVSGRNFAQCPGSFVVLWDGAERAGATVGSFGNFSTTLTVPDDAEPRAHRITARCTVAAATGGTASPVATFTVVADRPAATPQLAVEPASGAAGQRLRATGTGFDACAGDNAVLWFDARGSGGSATVPVSATSYGFGVDLVVPTGLPTGPHTLYAACARRAEVAASADFTVLAAAAGPSGSSPSSGTSGVSGTSGTSGSSGLSSGSSPSSADPVLGAIGNDTSGGSGLTGPQRGVLLGGALLLAGAGSYGLVRRRGPGWVGKHVTAHGRPTGPGSHRVAEDTDPDGRSHSVRLEPRPDPGTQHIEETER